jgi:hypothetical protein
MRSAWILGWTLVLLAPAAQANWLRSCQAGATASSVGGGGSFVCHNPTADDDDPGVLDVSTCENVDIFWYDNVTGDGGGDLDGTAAIFTCPVVANAALDTEAERLAGCQPLNGGTTLSPAATEIQGLGAVRIWADVELASVENQLVVRNMGLRGWLALLVGAALVSLGAGVGFKRDPFGDALTPGLSGSTGNDATLAYLRDLSDFQDLGAAEIHTRLWANPYTGSDATGTGRTEAPFRSFSRLKQYCDDYTQCSVQGKDRVFSPLTFVVDGIAAGEAFQRGETVTWAAGASTGTVLDWVGSSNILVIDRDTGTDPDCCAVTFTGSQSAATGTDVSRTDTLGGAVSERVVTFVNATELVNIAGHYYVTGQGPMRLFNDGGALPTGLSEGTDYWVCTVVAGVSFQLDATSSACGAIATFTTDGTGTTDITGLQNTLLEDTIVPACADPDALCMVFDSEFPDHPATLDANGFHVTGLTAAAAPDVVGAAGATPTGGVPHAGGDGTGGWVGWANIHQQNMDNKAVFAVAGAGSQGKVFSLNSNALAIRDGTNGRSFGVAGSAHNNCLAATGGDAATGGGVAWAVNSNCHDYSDSAIGSGSAIVPAESGSVFAIGGSYRAESVAANWSPVVTMTNGNLVLLSVDAYSSTTVFGSLMNASFNRDSYVQMARVLWVLRASTGFGYGFQYIATDAGSRVDIYESSFAAVTDGALATYAMLLGDFTNLSFLRIRGLLIDGWDWWINTTNTTTAITNLDLDIQLSLFDDDDATGPNAADEWNITGVADYATRADFETAIRGVLTDDSQWDIYEDGFDTAGASNDYADAVTYRCVTTGQCWERYRTPYTVSFESRLHTEPAYSCSPAGVLPGGARLCSLSLVPTHIGAR